MGIEKAILITVFVAILVVLGAVLLFALTELSGGVVSCGLSLEERMEQADARLRNAKDMVWRERCLSKFRGYKNRGFLII